MVEQQQPQVVSSEGVSKLIDFLNNTRRQAELSIGILNERVQELQGEVDDGRRELEKALTERDYFKNLSDQLQMENSKKWRLQERDDWKSLVDSIQGDRARLQDECLKLQMALETANGQVMLLEQQLLEQEQEQEHQHQEQAAIAEERQRGSVSRQSGEDEVAAGAASARSSKPRSLSEAVPSAEASGVDEARHRQLLLEVEQLKQQLDIERKAHSTEKLSLEVEISALRTEIEQLRRVRSLPDAPSQMAELKRTSSFNLNSRGTTDSVQTGPAGVPVFKDTDPRVAVVKRGSSFSWTNPVGSLFSYLFRTNSDSVATVVYSAEVLNV